MLMNDLTRAAFDIIKEAKEQESDSTKIEYLTAKLDALLKASSVLEVTNLQLAIDYSYCTEGSEYYARNSRLLDYAIIVHSPFFPLLLSHFLTTKEIRSVVDKRQCVLIHALCYSIITSNEDAFNLLLDERSFDINDYTINTPNGIMNSARNIILLFTPLLTISNFTLKCLTKLLINGADPRFSTHKGSTTTVLMYAITTKMGTNIINQLRAAKALSIAKTAYNELDNFKLSANFLKACSLDIDFVFAYLQRHIELMSLQAQGNYGHDNEDYHYIYVFVAELGRHFQSLKSMELFAKNYATLYKNFQTDIIAPLLLTHVPQEKDQEKLILADKKVITSYFDQKTKQKIGRTISKEKDVICPHQCTEKLDPKFALFESKDSIETYINKLFLEHPLKDSELSHTMSIMTSKKNQPRQYQSTTINDTPYTLFSHVATKAIREIPNSNPQQMKEWLTIKRKVVPNPKTNPLQKENISRTAKKNHYIHNSPYI